MHCMFFIDFWKYVVLGVLWSFAVTNKPIQYIYNSTDLGIRVTIADSNDSDDDSNDDEVREVIVNPKIDCPCLLNSLLHSFAVNDWNFYISYPF